jgi:hypothetical protein
MMSAFPPKKTGGSAASWRPWIGFILPKIQQVGIATVHQLEAGKVSRARDRGHSARIQNREASSAARHCSDATRHTLGSFRNSLSNN